MVETTSQHVKVEVFDKDLGKDDLLGVADLSLVDIVVNPLVPPQWIPLQNCKSGEILLMAKLSMGQIQQEIEISNYMEELPSDSSSSDTEDEGEEDIKRLNNKLISYIDKVRLIQQSTESWKGIPAQDDRSGEIQMLKDKYETELKNWENKYQLLVTDLSQANNENGRNKEQNIELANRLREKDDLLNEKMTIVSQFEKKLAELTSDLTIAQNENGRMKEDKKIHLNEISHLRISLQEAKDELDKELVINSNLQGRLEVTEKDLLFKIHMLEEQLNEERKRSKLDFSSMNFKIKSEYEKRLKSELKRLRKTYQQETLKSKEEFTQVHAKKISELQHLLSSERSTNISAKEELKNCKDRLDDLKKRVAELESINLQLSQRKDSLESLLVAEEAAFKSKLVGKENEVNDLKKEMDQQKILYANIMEVKLALDTEIRVYKNLIDVEEKRITRGETLVNGISSAEETELPIVVANSHRKSSSSSSSSSEDEEEKPGFLEKVKDII